MIAAETGLHASHVRESARRLQRGGWIMRTGHKRIWLLPGAATPDPPTGEQLEQSEREIRELEARTQLAERVLDAPANTNGATAPQPEPEPAPKPRPAASSAAVERLVADIDGNGDSDSSHASRIRELAAHAIENDVDEFERKVEKIRTVVINLQLATPNDRAAVAIKALENITS